MSSPASNPAPHLAPAAAPPAAAVPGWRATAFDLLLVVLLGAAALTLISRFLDNSILVTGNGIWKSRMVRRWMEGPWPDIDYPNVLYYPFYGLTLRLLPVKPDDLLWSWMATINLGWAVVALLALYFLLRVMGIGRGPALVGVLVQLGCAFFMGLAVTSEDIMPGHALTVLAMALTVRAINDPTPHWRISALVAALVFNFCWLFEWRLMFPLAPAIGLAYLLAPMPPRQRGLRLATFIAMALALVGLTALVITVLYHQRPTSALNVAINMLWTGKGVGTGWAGWSGDKIVLLFIGTSQYLIGGANVLTIPWLWEPSHLAWCLAAWLIMVGLLAGLLRAVTRRWGQPRWRAAGVILLGNFVAGTVFNLYSQPQDPQMQIHVMVWVPVAAAVLLEQCRGRGVALQRWVTTIGALAGLALLYVNVFSPVGFVRYRGLDTRCREGVAAIRHHTDVESTLFLFYGFELALPVL